MATCRYCAAELRWARTENGKAMPLDARPDPDGNVILMGNRATPIARVLAGADLLEWRGQLWMPHRATCPGTDSPVRPPRTRT